MTSLIIPCYWANQELVDITQKCLDSLKYGRPDEVIVVDDWSPIPFTSFYFKGKQPDLTVAPAQERNLGYAGAVNAGLKEAKSDVMIVSNNDIVFTPGWLEAILKPLEQGYDIASIRTSDNGYETEDKITEGDKFGSLWAMRRQVYDTIGGLDESFGKGYFEDLDYQKRAEAAGFKVGKNHAHLVEHVGKATFKTVDADDTAYLTAMEKYRQKYGVVE